MFQIDMSNGDNVYAIFTGKNPMTKDIQSHSGVVEARKRIKAMSTQGLSAYPNEFDGETISWYREQHNDWIYATLDCPGDYTELGKINHTLGTYRVFAFHNISTNQTFYQVHNNMNWSSGTRIPFTNYTLLDSHKQLHMEFNWQE